MDLSLESVLDRYLAFAQKSFAANKITPAVFANLSKQIANYKKLLAEIDKNSDVKKSFGRFYKSIKQHCE